MLGLQETRSTRTAATETYRCVMCSASFHTLAALVVHEKSHDLSSMPKVTSSTCSDCGSLFESTELLEKHCCMALPISVTQNAIKCEHEERPLACSSIQEHTKEQGTETFPELTKDLKTEHFENSSSMEKVPKESLHKIQTRMESKSTVDADHVPSTILHGQLNELQSTNSCCSTLTEVQGQSFDNDTDANENGSVSTFDKSTDQSNKSSNTGKTLLKVLASAYMNCRQPAQINWAQNKRSLPPRKVSPRAPVLGPMTVTTLSNELPVNHQSEETSGCKTLIQSVKPINNVPKKSLISMTKILCPVVALETHQKLISENIEGRHQCGLCRRVFQDKDSLVMHHALHRKEKVQFCRHCHEFVLSAPSRPFNHDCISSHAGPLRSFFTTLHLNSKKLFQCLLCNRTYTRRHRLKVHKCQAAGGPARKKYQGICRGGANIEKQSNNELGSGDYNYETNPPLQVCDFQSGLAKSFPPFLPNVSEATSVQSTERVIMVGEESEYHLIDENRKKTETNELLKNGQWTVPLDDAEVDVISDEECGDALNVCKEKPDEEVIIVEPAVKPETKSIISNKDIRVHISDLGVRRFSCNRCQRSYARRFTLIQHLKICRTERYMEPKKSSNVQGVEKMFPCPQCGSSFTRKDNMKMHLKRCQLVRPYSMDRNMMKQNQAGHDCMFVLPPDPQNQIRQDDDNGGGGSWGIMSLPAVLPRKVTCECGAAFTCPRLLFEHLQKHAQESYICSQCGDYLHSWADLEAHRNLHMQSSRQNIPDKVSPQQQSHMHPQSQPGYQSSEQNLKREAPNFWRSRLNHRPFTGPYVCHRCKKVFRLRKSLLRHLSRSCKGATAVQIKHSCTRCDMAFQNPLALDAHIHLDNCRPAFKPLRCPVCVRWFSSLEGLKRHLLTHSQQEDPICQICDYKCSSHLALEEHKKTIHGLNRFSESSTVQSATISQSSSSNAFRCQICQRTYPKLRSLKDHLRKVHRPKSLMSINVDTSESKPDTRLLTETVQQSMFKAAVQLSPETVQQSLSEDLLQSSTEAVQQSQSKAVLQSTQTAQQSHSKHLKCHICTCTFTDIQSLINHKRTVHHIFGGGLPPLKGTLQSSHSTPFQCQVCARSYPDMRSLRNHRRRVHHIIGGLGIHAETYKVLTHPIQDLPFKCQICLRSYPHLASLKKHRRRVHNIFASNALNPAKVNNTIMKQSPRVFLPVRAQSQTVETDADV